VTVFDDFLATSVPAGAVGVMWLGQATVALRVDGAVMLVDPFLSAHPERLVPPPCSGADARGVDAVLVTHDHLDHLDDATLAAVAAASPYAAIVTPPEVVERVVGLGIDKRRVRGLPAWETTSAAGVVVRAVPAKHGIDVGLQACTAATPFETVDVSGNRVAANPNRLDSVGTRRRHQARESHGTHWRMHLCDERVVGRAEHGRGRSRAQRVEALVLGLVEWRPHRLSTLSQRERSDQSNSASIGLSCRDPCGSSPRRLRGRRGSLYRAAECQPHVSFCFLFSRLRSR
jgi:hypothetical protein